MPIPLYPTPSNRQPLTELIARRYTHLPRNWADHPHGFAAVCLDPEADALDELVAAAAAAYPPHPTPSFATDGTGQYGFVLFGLPEPVRSLLSWHTSADGYHAVTVEAADVTDLEPVPLVTQLARLWDPEVYDEDALDQTLARLRYTWKQAAEAAVDPGHVLDVSTTLWQDTGYRGNYYELVDTAILLAG
jgi:hypothetical protein